MARAGRARGLSWPEPRHGLALCGRAGLAPQKPKRPSPLARSDRPRTRRGGGRGPRDRAGGGPVARTRHPECWRWPAASELGRMARVLWSSPARADRDANRARGAGGVVVSDGERAWRRVDARSHPAATLRRSRIGGRAGLLDRVRSGGPGRAYGRDAGDDRDRFRRGLRLERRRLLASRLDQFRCRLDRGARDQRRSSARPLTLVRHGAPFYPPAMPALQPKASAALAPLPLRPLAREALRRAPARALGEIERDLAVGSRTHLVEGGLADARAFVRDAALAHGAVGQGASTLSGEGAPLTRTAAAVSTSLLGRD